MNGEPIINERLLFRRIAEGDVKSFEIIYHRYADTLLRHAYSIMNSEFWAEEIIQETFTKIWKDRHLLRNIEKPSPYLYRIVSNLCFSKIRVREKEIRLQYYMASQPLTIAPESFFSTTGGHHGYDPNIPQMYTGFIAYGAEIRKGKMIDELCVTDIALLVAKLLGLEFKTPDGKLGRGFYSN